jgi:hypothetical protein
MMESRVGKTYSSLVTGHIEEGCIKERDIIFHEMASHDVNLQYQRKPC